MPALDETDHAAIKALTGEIMHLVDNCTSTADLKQSITDLLTRRITEATRAYEQQLAAEETHTTDGTVKHHISDCSQWYCGRYAGQRRQQ
jgi:hypothetical protein